MNWEPRFWRKKTQYQIPKYDNQEDLTKVEKILKQKNGLVFNEKIQNLKKQLMDVQNGKAFIIQGGDCAESFDYYSKDSVTSTINVLEKIKDILRKSLNKDIITIGRIAGQFAKPRSEEFEIFDGKKILSYRGDMVNGVEKTKKSRTPNPSRMLRAYEQSKNILDLIGEKIYTSHDALLLNYEESLLRKNQDEKYILTSTHLPWIGVRTCYPDSAHIEFMRGIDNPIAIKCKPSQSINDLERIITILNPKNECGKIVLIPRAGVESINEFLVTLIEMVKKNNFNVIWVSDPMHGNTKSINGIKVRYVEDIICEIQCFRDICNENNICMGGIHLEMTGEDTLECITKEQLSIVGSNYKSLCDPRLNSEQAIKVVCDGMGL